MSTRPEDTGVAAGTGRRSDMTSRRLRRRAAANASPPADVAGGLLEGNRPWLTPGRLFSLVMVLIATYAAITIVVALRTVLIMLLVALFLSFAMEPAVQWLAQRGWRRGLATGLVFLVAFLALAGVAASLATLFIDQVQGLVQSVPFLLDQLGDEFDVSFLDELGSNPDLLDQVENFEGDLAGRLQNVVLGAAGNVVNIGATAFGVLFQLLSIALVTFYLVADGPRARQVMARPLPPDRQREMLAIWELAVAKTGGYFYSRLLLAGASTVATAVFLLVLGVPYPIPLALLVGTTSVFIPVVGTYVGGVLVVVVAFVDQASRGQTPTNVLWSLGFLVLYQQIENYLLAPRVQAHTMDVHPAVAFVSVLVGGTLLGAVGALLALPAAAIIQALLSTYVRRHQLISELSGVPLPGEPRAPSRAAGLDVSPAAQQEAKA
jgi:predicted PurR-regulated permease PerM